MSVSTDDDILNKNRELLDIARLCVAEGEVGDRGETFIIAQQGPNSIEKIWPEFRPEKSLEFWLEIPYTRKMFKIG